MACRRTASGNRRGVQCLLLGLHFPVRYEPLSSTRFARHWARGFHRWTRPQEPLARSAVQFLWRTLDQLNRQKMNL